MMKKRVGVCALAVLLIGAYAQAAPVVDGTISSEEYSNWGLTTGTWHVESGVYDLPKVYAYADEDALYMGFEAIGAKSHENADSGFGGVIGVNIGLDRDLTTATTATLGENGAWSFAMETFTDTADGEFSTGTKQYKYNDAGVDGAGSAQTFAQPASTLGGDFDIVITSSTTEDTQIVEYAIAMDALEAAFARTYQDGSISAGDELKIVGFFNRNAQAWAPISFPDGGQWGPAFGTIGAYAPVFVAAAEGAEGGEVPEPTTLAVWGTLSGLGLIAARRRRKRAA